eukprot:scaffold5885_cov220-Pinguiococcus_pyrenoidosus.AAC.3
MANPVVKIDMTAFGSTFSRSHSVVLPIRHITRERTLPRRPGDTGHLRYQRRRAGEFRKNFRVRRVVVGDFLQCLLNSNPYYRERRPADARLACPSNLPARVQTTRIAILRHLGRLCAHKMME